MLVFLLTALLVIIAPIINFSSDFPTNDVLTLRAILYCNCFIVVLVLLLSLNLRKINPNWFNSNGLIKLN